MAKASVATFLLVVMIVATVNVLTVKIVATVNVLTVKIVATVLTVMSEGIATVLTVMREAIVLTVLTVLSVASKRNEERIRSIRSQMNTEGRSIQHIYRPNRQPEIESVNSDAANASVATPSAKFLLLVMIVATVKVLTVKIVATFLTVMRKAIVATVLTVMSEGIATVLTVMREAIVPTVLIVVPTVLIVLYVASERNEERIRSIRGQMNTEGRSIQHIYRPNRQPEIESVNSDAAKASVATPSQELQPDEITAAKLYTENVPSVVFITNIALRQNVFTRHLVEQGHGTGFFWDEKGYIVTNYHVIQGASYLRVKLHDKSEYDAVFIEGNQDTDVAVLVIDTPKKLRPVLVGSSRNLKEGQNVYAIGNPFHFGCSLTTGIISKLGGQINSPANGNPISNVIHITATIGPGSSGGPLFESSGSLIGINTAMHTISGVSTGFGFSIPVDSFSYHVSSIVDQFEALKKNETHTGIRFAPDLSVEQLGVAGVPLQMGQQEKQDRS